MGLCISQTFGGRPEVGDEWTDLSKWLSGPLAWEERDAEVGKTALSLGERVSDDGAFFSRRRTGEGFLPKCDAHPRLGFVVC